MARQSKRAALLLLFLSPITAELVTGSSPPLIFFNPIVLLLFLGFYGTGALMMRELMIRWQKGYASLLVLGVAYGIIEEGLVVKSFFNPSWPDLSIMATYGRWLGVNWVWSFDLAVYHAVVSIVIPVILVELVYPEARGQSLLGNTAMVFAGIVFALDSALFYFVLTPYVPPLVPYVGTLALVLVLFIVACRFPEKWDFHGTRPCPSRRRLWAIGLMWMVLNWLIYFHLPRTGVHPIVTIALGIGMALLLYRYFRTLIWDNDLDRLSVVAGVMTFSIIMAPVFEMVAVTAEPMTGMTLTGAAYALFLLYVRHRIKSSSVSPAV